MAFRILQIGLGNRGNMWADIIAAHPDAELAGVMDIDSARLEAFAARYPAPARFSDLSQALAARRL